ncbi:hypothetical protein GGX14DRAFT_567251 [Mycena pura]|uniref:Uncharacterized protein n=1 Tax=Mycena pura TaxID=153505 RepID=A0AAD6VB33_9AGAR|nr:hypothetical protein GGX14DRAFT_567251 [Mycena pura]
MPTNNRLDILGTQPPDESYDETLRPSVVGPRLVSTTPLFPPVRHPSLPPRVPASLPNSPSNIPAEHVERVGVSSPPYASVQKRRDASRPRNTFTDAFKRMLARQSSTTADGRMPAETWAPLAVPNALHPRLPRHAPTSTASSRLHRRRRRGHSVAPAEDLAVHLLTSRCTPAPAYTGLATSQVASPPAATSVALVFGFVNETDQRRFAPTAVLVRVGMQIPRHGHRPLHASSQTACTCFTHSRGTFAVVAVTDLCAMLRRQPNRYIRASRRTMMATASSCLAHRPSTLPHYALPNGGVERMKGRAHPPRADLCYRAPAHHRTAINARRSSHDWHRAHPSDHRAPRVTSTLAYRHPHNRTPAHPAHQSYVS